MTFDIADLARDVRKLVVDVYLGTDKENPSIITRLTLLENNVEKINSNLSKLVWLSFGILGTAITNIYLHVAGK